MALLIECMLKCAPILIDNADIVREAILRQVTKSAQCAEGCAPPHLQATALKVLLDEVGTEVNVELYQW